MSTAPDPVAPGTHPGEAAARELLVPIAKPAIGELEIEAIQKPLDSGWVVQGPYVAAFEERFAAYTGAAHAVATTSCTTALHLAVAILGLKPGDEVIVPAFTWVSTPNVVEYMGAKPVFCDIDLDTFNADPGALEAAVTADTVGAIPVHLFGLCAQMEPVTNAARQGDFWIVEDAACGFGAVQAGRHAGTFGEIGAFSFHPRKSLTTGEGGMLTTSNEDWSEAARSLRDHGAGQSDLDRHTSPHAFLLSDFDQLGFNYRMTDIQGALGLAQMERADWILDERRRRAAIYDDAIAELDWLAAPVVPKDNAHGYQSYVCLFRPEHPSLDNLDALSERRNALMARMEARGVATRQGTHAAALTNFYSRKYGIRPEQFPNAAIAEKLSIALPLYPGMTDSEQELVLSELTSAFEAG